MPDVPWDLQLKDKHGQSLLVHCFYGLKCFLAIQKSHCIIWIIVSAKFYKGTYAQCLKMIEKGSFNIASEATYICIWSAQKLITNANG